MKNSFFLVIPEQRPNPELLKSFEETALQQWVIELPIANPGLATRLLYDLLKGFTRLEMDPMHRLEALELLRPSYVIIEDYLRSRLIKIGFPKGDDELKIHNVLVAIEKEFAVGYWIIARQLTRRNTSWFQGKNIALSIQRVIKGLSNIVITHYIMSLPVPDWVWIDLHSLHKLGIKLKKETTKVADDTCLSKSSSILDCYRQILLLSIADPTGLMQKEIQQVYRFTEKINNLVPLNRKQTEGRANLCVVLIDEDQAPFYTASGNIDAEAAALYLNFDKLLKALSNRDKFVNPAEARFSSIHAAKTSIEKLPQELINYLEQRWSGVPLQGATFFNDRLDRNFSVGLNSTHDLQAATQNSKESHMEFLAESSSDRSLSCKFGNSGLLSIGSLISFRKTDFPVNKRSLGVVNKISISNADEKVIFEVEVLALQSYAVNYLTLDAEPDAEPQKALIYGVKSEQGERSYLIVESFMFNNEDVLRLFMNNNNFPIVLGNKKNVGLGYWQFECRQVIETEKVSASKKGFDFI